jgi:2-polyprenyl-6-methoxyphenol hydroxylase-like FAD-dependent oxidoreductase
MIAPSLAGELAQHDRAAFERASASPAMIRSLVEAGALGGRAAAACLTRSCLTRPRRPACGWNSGCPCRAYCATLAPAAGSLRSRPALSDLLAGAVVAERPRGTAALPTFFRTAAGPGWALAGDAGHHKDPLIARGIADAFRDADLVSAAVVDGWDGDLDAALAGYAGARDRCAIPLSDANLAVARLDRPAAALGAAWVQMSDLELSLDGVVRE